MRIRDLAHARPRFGYQPITVLLRREGWSVNRKRVRRLYRLQGLQLRMRVRRHKHMCLHRWPAPIATRTHERWSMDFVHDALFDGRPFRVLTVVDQYSRQSPVLEPAFAHSGRSVSEVLERLVAKVGAPASITVDHGTEFTSKALEDWAWRRGVKLDFIRPGKPTENGHIESFNGRLGDECLNVNQFETFAVPRTHRPADERRGRVRAPGRCVARESGRLRRRRRCSAGRPRERAPDCRMGGVIASRS
jgi:putative transposase